MEKLIEVYDEAHPKNGGDSERQIVGLRDWFSAPIYLKSHYRPPVRGLTP